MPDLRDPRLMLLKAALLVAIGVIAGGLLLLDSFTWKTAVLLCLCVWGFARAYYFAFYVIERYIDPKFKFAGLFSVVRYFFSRDHARQ